MMGGTFIPARQVAQHLASRIDALARELLPLGRREGAEWVAPSHTGTSRRALSVRLTGTKAGVWSDFSASGVHGDALDLVAHVLFRGDKTGAYSWALAWLGLGAKMPTPLPRIAPQAAPPRADDPNILARRKAALAVFLNSETMLRGTPVDGYLQGRGIALAELGRQPRSLRNGAAVFNQETGTNMPAMLAAISAPGGRHAATHRTWLAQDEAGTWRKARLQAPKKVLGSYAGGCIRLWRGASGKPLEKAPESDTTVIAEGIETALSIVVACPEYRVLCGVSLSNLGRIILPAACLDLIVAADNDFGNAAAEAALAHAVDRLLSEGRSVRIARSSIGKDFNDALSGSK
jgi:hypothetical protein